MRGKRGREKESQGDRDIETGTVPMSIFQEKMVKTVPKEPWEKTVLTVNVGRSACPETRECTVRMECPEPEARAALLARE